MPGLWPCCDCTPRPFRDPLPWPRWHGARRSRHIRECRRASEFEDRLHHARRALVKAIEQGRGVGKRDGVGDQRDEIEGPRRL
ncbi:DUF982 domain-containing protein [Sphingomonas antarctica]|uniref:DUF982 domain-containing protein n=1 Tax=Sphingomonas antarctica TaxID=2040274 RepID=UPI0039ED709E